MKFEEMTVTFQPIKPNKPIIIITEAEHPIKGKVTHLKHGQLDLVVGLISIRPKMLVWLKLLWIT